VAVQSRSDLVLFHLDLRSLRLRRTSPVNLRA
jgi:hypothetical protein